MMKFTTIMLVGLLIVLLNQSVSGCDCGVCLIPIAVCCSCNSGCFPAIAKVQQRDGNLRNMTELQVGHSLTTVNSNGDLVATEVIAFMKQRHTVHGLYAHIRTAKGNEVVMSPDHLILSATPGHSQTFAARFAKDIQVGDLVKVADGETCVEISKVVDVKMSVLKGAYVPLTKEGTLLVDGVLTSSYATIDHDVAHFFVTPLRWFPGVLGAYPSTDGSHPYVDFIRNIGKWLMPGGLQSKQNKVWNYVAKTLYRGTATY